MTRSTMTDQDAAPRDHQARPSPLVDAYLELCGVADVDRTIDPADEMLHTIERHRRRGDDAHRMIYLRTGLGPFRSIEHVARTVGRPLETIGGVLDFACGRGRVTRFLARACGGARVWAADIDADAVRFVASMFGVHGFASCPDPADLAVDRRFDLIFVGSLFSHLPKATFGPWLRRLFDLLEDDGLFLFSTNRLPAAEASPSSPGGFAFHPESETERLAKRDYGTTHVRPDALAALARAAGIEHLHTLERELWLTQDLHVASRHAEPALDRLGPAPNAHGEIGSLRIGPRGRVWIAGQVHHAAALGALGDVRLCVGGRDVSGVNLGPSREDGALLVRDWYAEGDAHGVGPGEHVVCAVAEWPDGRRSCFDAMAFTL